NGEIGEGKSVSSTRYGGELWYKERQPDWNDMHYKMRNWYYYNWLSGDFIVEMFVHSTDMIAWAMGERMPLSATGVGGRQWRTDKKYGNIYDHFAVEFDYGEGLKRNVSTSQSSGRLYRKSVEVSGWTGNANSQGNKHETGSQNTRKCDGERNHMTRAKHEAVLKSMRCGSAIND